MTRPSVSEVEKLLDEVEPSLKEKMYQKTAYNYLIDYIDIGFYDSLEADRLLGLCIEIMNDLRKD